MTERIATIDGVTISESKLRAALAALETPTNDVVQEVDVVEEGRLYVQSEALLTKSTVTAFPLRRFRRKAGVDELSNDGGRTWEEMDVHYPIHVYVEDGSLTPYEPEVGKVYSHVDKEYPYHYRVCGNGRYEYYDRYDDRQWVESLCPSLALHGIRFGSMYLNTEAVTTITPIDKRIVRHRSDKTVWQYQNAAKAWESVNTGTSKRFTTNVLSTTDYNILPDYTIKGAPEDSDDDPGY